MGALRASVSLRQTADVNAMRQDCLEDKYNQTTDDHIIVCIYYITG